MKAVPLFAKALLSVVPVRYHVGTAPDESCQLYLGTAPSREKRPSGTVRETGHELSCPAVPGLAVSALGGGSRGDESRNNAEGGMT
jgi:hypothetical protein